MLSVNQYGTSDTLCEYGIHVMNACLAGNKFESSIAPGSQNTHPYDLHSGMRKLAVRDSGTVARIRKRAVLTPTDSPILVPKHTATALIVHLSVASRGSLYLFACPPRQY